MARGGTGTALLGSLGHSSSPAPVEDEDTQGCFLCSDSEHRPWPFFLVTGAESPSAQVNPVLDLWCASELFLIISSLKVFLLSPALPSLQPLFK